MNRIPVSVETIEETLELARQCLQKRIKQKGSGAFASIHETLGIITEEYEELIDATRSNNENHQISELHDIAIGALWGLVSIRELQKRNRKVNGSYRRAKLIAADLNAEITEIEEKIDKII